MLTQGQYSLPVVIALAVLLQACASTSVPEPEPGAEEVPEITLNLPQENDCACVDKESSSDYTFLENGYASLAEGDYVAAVQHFQRYLRLEKTAEAQWESAMAIAYISSLSNSPFYDAEAARNSWRDLNKEDWQSMSLHQQSLLMRQSMETSIALERHVTELEGSNATLRNDLQKREEAIKRLRELTLGQKGAAQ